MSQNKYRARKVTIDGTTFDSQREATAYCWLKARLQKGEIRDLRLQVSYDLHVRGICVCRYVADFVYVEVATGQTVVADAKGFRTPIYKLKKKLMYAVHNIGIIEL